MEHKITISTDDKSLIDKILSLVKDEGVVVQWEQQSFPKKNDVVELMNELSKEIGKPSIKDPVSWQRKIRKERKLPFRDK